MGKMYGGVKCSDCSNNFQWVMYVKILSKRVHGRLGIEIFNLTTDK